MRSSIHVGSLEDFTYHHHTVNAVLLTISFPLPTWAAVGELVLYGSLVPAYCLIETLAQVLIVVFIRKSVCGMGAASRCCGLRADSACQINSKKDGFCRPLIIYKLFSVLHELYENCFLCVKSVFCLVENFICMSFKYLSGDFLASVSRQAVLYHTVCLCN